MHFPVQSGARAARQLFSGILQGSVACEEREISKGARRIKKKKRKKKKGILLFVQLVLYNEQAGTNKTLKSCKRANLHRRRSSKHRLSRTSPQDCSSSLPMFDDPIKFIGSQDINLINAGQDSIESGSHLVVVAVGGGGGKDRKRKTKVSREQI